MMKAPFGNGGGLLCICAVQRKDTLTDTAYAR